MRELSLNGYIDEESWFGDEITPDSLHELLYGKDNAATDDVHIRLNSYGGPATPPRGCLTIFAHIPAA